jgi:glycosyltransferase involved in cell wall biosynthesis
MISVIVPTYNREQWVGGAIASILNQDFKDLEVLVMDDCSTDSTREIVEGIEDSRVRYFHNPNNLGVPGNVNKGISESRGYYIFIFHDSDLAQSSTVKKMHKLLQENPSVAYVHAGIEFVDHDDRPISLSVGSYSKVSPGSDWLPRMLSKFNSEVSAITMAPRLIYERWGLYDPDYGFYSDVEWAIRMCVYGDVGYINEPLIMMREREFDHPFRKVRWETFLWSIKMRENHISAVSNRAQQVLIRIKVAWEMEKSLTLATLSCLKRRDILRLRQGKSTLRYGRLIPRIVSALL